MQNRLAEVLLSVARQVLSVFMMFFWVDSSGQRERWAVRRNRSGSRTISGDPCRHFWLGTDRLQLLTGEKPQSRVGLPGHHLSFSCAMDAEPAGTSRRPRSIGRASIE